MNNLNLIKTGILLLIILSANGAQAQGIFLSDLINGGSITVGDKIFNNWSFTETASDNAFLLNAANIEVAGLPATGNSLLDPGPGLAFNIFNGGATVTGDGIYSYLDFTINFMASVLSGSPYGIKDVSLGLGANSLNGSHDLGVFVQEDVRNAANNLIATTDVGANVLNGALSSNLSNSTLFPGQKTINVTKNVLVWSAGLGETATLNGFNQHFSQVPEPGTLFLLTIGLFGVGITRMHRI